MLGLRGGGALWRAASPLMRFAVGGTSAAPTFENAPATLRCGLTMIGRLGGATRPAASVAPGAIQHEVAVLR
jgi:hypothetical protein